MTGVFAGSLPEDRRTRTAALFDTHHERLYRLARRLTSSQDDALDLVQETFLRAARSRVVPDDDAAERWLVRVLVNIRRDQWRRERIRKLYQHELHAPSNRDDGLETRLVASATVWQAVDTLPPRRRAVVVLHELEGLSAAAIASLLGISAITVRWHLSRGRRELAHAIASKPGRQS